MHAHTLQSAIFYNQQRSLIKQAVVKDSEGKLGLAVTLYCEALEHFLPALECRYEALFFYF